MPKISVIVPVYNAKKTIKKCVDSIINQTLKDIEIILVDDGSNDGSEVLCDEYSKQDLRIKVIHQQNSGLGKAYNVGIKAATGDYIGFVESDDYAELNMFEDLYNVAQKDDSDLVKSNWFDWKSLKNENQVHDSIKENCVTNVYQKPEILQIQPSIWSAIYRRNLIFDNDIWFLETPGASYQDTSFAFKITTISNKISLVKTPYIHYCVDNEFSSVKAKDKAFVICCEYEEIAHFLETKNIVDKNIWDKKYTNQWFGYLWNLERIDKKYQKDFVEKITDEFSQYYAQGHLTESFISMLNIFDLNNFSCSKENFKKCLSQKFAEKLKKDNRRKYISIHLNKKEIYLKIFGVEIVNINKGSIV